MSSSSNNSTITLHLTVTAEQGAPRVPLECPKTATCTELRTLAAQATHIPLVSLKLIFRGRLIANANDKMAVEEFKLEHGSVLHCMGKPEKPTETTSSTATTATANNNNDSSNNNSSATPVAAVPALASSTTTTSSSSPTSLESALQHLRQSNSPATYTTATTTLQKILQNIIDHPLDEKYRKVKKHNAAFAKRLGGVQGGDNVMRAAGFVIVTDQAVESYVLNADPQAWTQLLQHKEQVDRAVTRAKAAATMTAPPTASASLGGGFPSMPPVGGVSPMQQQMAAQMMSDPQALQTMLQNPMVQQMVRNDPRFAQMAPMMQELANNPAMAQQLSQMMQNPQLQQQMQQVMAQQQQGNAGASAFPNLMPPEAAPTNNNTNNAAAFPNFMPPGTQNNNNNNTNAGPSDDQLTEEEMIAEAIRRSLQDDNNNNNNNSS